MSYIWLICDAIDAIAAPLAMIPSLLRAGRHRLARVGPSLGERAELAPGDVCYRN